MKDSFCRNIPAIAAKKAHSKEKLILFNRNFAIETALLQNSSRPIGLIRLEKLTIGATDSSLDRGTKKIPRSRAGSTPKSLENQDLFGPKGKILHWANEKFGFNSYTLGNGLEIRFPKRILFHLEYLPINAPSARTWSFITFSKLALLEPAGKSRAVSSA